MTALQTIAVAFAMFSALPMPQFEWIEKNMRYALCAFPLVGEVCGVLWCVCGVLPLPAAARAAGFCLVPVWVTGGIHLDGYVDTCDALSSYGDTAKKLEILKDPHCGAFAVIRLCSYFAAYFALCSCVAFTPRVGVLWTLALVGERALSGLAVAAFPLAKNTGLAHTFATAADRVRVRQVLAVLCAMLAVGLTALGGWALVLAAGCVFARYYVVAKNQFGGVTGDLAGWFLQKCEIWMLAALVDKALADGEEMLVILAHGGTQMAALERYGVPRRSYYRWCGPNAGGYVLDARDWAARHELRLVKTVQYTKESTC